jgi:hypothetical protein
VLYARVKKSNKEFIAKLSRQISVSESALIDTILESLRTIGSAKCSSLVKLLKPA